jgi:hypothetical protein
MNRLSGTMQTARTSAWLSAFGLLLSAVLAQAVQSAPQSTPPAPRPEPLPATVEFNRDIRPILSDKCFQCHGPAAQMAALRFDSEEGAKKALKDGRFAIVSGDPAGSQMIARVTATNAAVRMPRSQNGAAAGDPLSEREVAFLTRWIEQGASWQRHWSFIPPKRPELPKELKDPKWARNPIDAFVLQRLEREGLKPSPEADKATLLRRVSLDLIGLPPTPAELDAFLKDTSSNAYEKVVDRLLRSPQYGERMAFPWLDAARYADSNGYQTDGERFMWRWRDWVIDAFNRNMPYDQFTTEQLAGDLLPEPEGRHGIQPQSPRQLGRRHRPRRIRRRVRRRSSGHDLHRVPRPDRCVRALPQPQVRSHLAEGVLSTLRVLQQRARARQVPASR